MKVANNFGSVEYSFEEDYVHIYNLYVKPEYRNQGNAKVLLEQAIAEIRNTGWEDEIQIVCNPEKEIDKEKLKRFYKRMGLSVYDYYG